MELHLVRHAHAGHRSAWPGTDADRPLSKKGRRQADAIASSLADAGIVRLLSSPAVRCVETLSPLADRLGLTVETDPRLAEGADVAGAMAVADELGAEDLAAAAVCSHGDVIPELLHTLRSQAMRMSSPFRWPKASTWIVSGHAGHWTTARYLGPPDL